MFTRVAALLVIFLFPLSASAQYEWYSTYAGSGYAGIDGMAMDKDNNIFAIANFENGINIGGVVLHGAGSCVAKLTSAGQVMWVKPIRYTGADFMAVLEVKVDGNGNAYICGHYPQKLEFGNTTLNNTGTFASFLIKMDGNGNVKWAKNYPMLQSLYQIAVNTAGDVGITSVLRNSPLSDGQLVLHGSGGFGALYDTDGNLRWARFLRNSEAASEFPVSITLDNAGNYYFCGRYEGNLTLDGHAVSKTGVNRYDLYFAKINTAGKCDWVKTCSRDIGGAFANSTIVEFGDMTTDISGNVYATGVYFKSMEIDGWKLTSSYSFNSEASSPYVLRLDPSGNVQWLQGPEPEGEGNSSAENVIVREDLLYFSGIDYSASPYYQILDPLDGSPVSTVTHFNIGRGDISGGLAVDQSHGVYLSGRYEEGPFAVRKGFIFKAGAVNLVGTPYDIDSQDEVCITGSLHATTVAISNATSYEWVLVADDQTLTYMTEDPALDISLSGFTNATTLVLKVRGVNDLGSGQYSDAKSIVLVDTSAPPEIAVECNSLVVVKGGNDVTWFHDEFSADADPGTTRFTPGSDGMFYVVKTNACGDLRSNEIQFEPLTIAGLFIPNIITPNGDTLNEYWVLDEKIPGADVSVHSRWGINLLHLQNYQNDWNAPDLPGGVYYYTIRHKCFPDGITGTLTVVR